MITKRNLFDEMIREYPVLPASDLVRLEQEVIIPRLTAGGKSFKVKSPTGHTLDGMTYTVDNPKGTIMISHGFTEAVEKFGEMIYYFMSEGYNVCIHSHWDHGNSRDEAPNGRPTHIDSFQYYVDDFAAVADSILPTLAAPYILYAHSMGGLVGALYLEQHPDVFTKAVFNAPMFEINRGGIPYFIAKAIATFLCKIGKGKTYLPGQGPFSEIPDFEHSAASCKERYQLYFDKRLKDPNLQNCGSSCRWALESFYADERMLKPENCSRITIPVLLFQAENDDFVLPGGHDAFMNIIPDGRYIFVPGAKHEIYLSDDEILKRYVQMIVEFL